jgi:hypothetical protein
MQEGTTGLSRMTQTSELIRDTPFVCGGGPIKACLSTGLVGSTMPLQSFKQMG